MAEILTLRPPPPIYTSTHHNPESGKWTSFQLKLKCKGKFTCLFSDGRKEEQARKALEGALGGKKNEFEKWDKEIQKRQQAGGGGSGGGGGGWFGWFGGFNNDDRFWQEAQQSSLALLGIVVVYLLLTKGDILFALVLNPLLSVLRETRNGLAFITSKFVGHNSSKVQIEAASAKQSVVSKWQS
uniref:Uncharacterized protein n=1 Tax=Kalanchoe fedtschenkoi TaxID=63787 RepID=A0A7N0UP60_KALFE